MTEPNKPEPPKEEPKVVEKEKPLGQKVKEIDHPPGEPPTVVVPPG